MVLAAYMRGLLWIKYGRDVSDVAKLFLSLATCVGVLMITVVMLPRDSCRKLYVAPTLKRKP